MGVQQKPFKNFWLKHTSVTDYCCRVTKTHHEVGRRAPRCHVPYSIYVLVSRIEEYNLGVLTNTNVRVRARASIALRPPTIITFCGLF